MEFATFFNKHYLQPPFNGWYLGAIPAGSAAAGQQTIESAHKSDKRIIGQAALQQPVEVFVRFSFPKIIMHANDKIRELGPGTVRPSCPSSR